MRAPRQATRPPRPSGDRPTTTHLMAGLGGDALAAYDAGFGPYVVVNHNPHSIASIRAALPGVFWKVQDVTTLQMTKLPTTDGLVGSPICTESRGTPGNLARRGPATLWDDDDGEIPDDMPLTRATAWCLLRAWEAHGYKFVAGENVPEFSTRFRAFRSWLNCWRDFNLSVQVASVNAAHVAMPGQNPVSQLRDRIVFLFTRQGEPLPDLRPRPDCVCPVCGPVQGVQQWSKDSQQFSTVQIGKYGQQYRYVCPNRKCGHARVEPVVWGASEFIDLTLPTRRLEEGRGGSRKFVPYADSTWVKAQAAIDRYGTDQPLIIHIGRTSNPRTLDLPLTTVTCKPCHALLIPHPQLAKSGLRMLTPGELAIAQGFDKGHYIAGDSEEDKYLQVGNAVPRRAGAWFMDRIGQALYPR